MNKDDLLDQQIERYLHHKMEDNERAAFEEVLNSNEELKKDVQSLAALLALYNTELFALKKKLDTTEDELEQEKFFDEGGES